MFVTMFLLSWVWTHLFLVDEAHVSFLVEFHRPYFCLLQLSIKKRNVNLPLFSFLSIFDVASELNLETEASFSDPVFDLLL